jgi:succinate dehydrogenase / fumarate reductase cytochrome b subunit
MKSNLKIFKVAHMKTLIKIINQCLPLIFDNMTGSEDQITSESRDPASSSRNVINWVTFSRKRGLGMWAWLLHRLSAIILIVTGVLHIMDNQFGFIIPGGDFVTVDLLVFSFAYHTFNGVRVILIESVGFLAKYEKVLFYLVVLATLVFMFWWAYAVGL